MAKKRKSSPAFNVMVVGQHGRLGYEAALFLASLKAAEPNFPGKVFIAEPQPGPLWHHDPRISNPDLRALIGALGGTILPFENRAFGERYPYGNKIEALFALPKDEPFVFFDSDTLVLKPLSDIPFDFDRPSASLRREGTWPVLELYGPGYTEIWRALYDKFNIPFESSLDLDQPDEYWQRYLYFDAGMFFYRCPRLFGQQFYDIATGIEMTPPKEIVCQSLDPWLDQIALPLVIHSLGGGRDTLPPGLIDGSVTCHYRMFPLLYAREADAVVETLERVAAPNKIKKVLKGHDPIKRMVYQERGKKVRALFDQNDLPRKEQMIRNRIKREGFWMR